MNLESKITLIERLTGGDPVSTVLAFVCLIFAAAVATIWLRCVAVENKVIDVVRANTVALTELSTIIKLRRD